MISTINAEQITSGYQTGGLVLKLRLKRTLGNMAGSYSSLLAPFLPVTCLCSSNRIYVKIRKNTHISHWHFTRVNHVWKHIYRFRNSKAYHVTSSDPFASIDVTCTNDTKPNFVASTINRTQTGPSMRGCA